MKRIIAILCCFALLTASIPFLVSAEEKSIEFEAVIKEGEFGSVDKNTPDALNSTYYGEGFIPIAINSIETRNYLLNNIRHEPEYGNTQTIEYLNSLDEDFFKEKTALMISAHFGSGGYTYTVENVSTDGNTVYIDTAYENPYDGPTVMCYYLAFVEVSNTDIIGCDKFVNRVTKKLETPNMEATHHFFEGYMPDEKLKQYDNENYEYFYRHINPYYCNHFPSMIIKSFEDLEKYKDYFVSEEFDEYKNSLAEDFFETKGLIISYSVAAYSPAEYAFDKIEGVYDSFRIHYTVDEFSGERTKERTEQQNIIVIEINQEDIGNAQHIYIYIERTNVLGDIYETGNIESLDYILLKRAYFGTYYLDEAAKKRGDINGNGKIDMTDYILLKRAWFETYKLYGDIRGIAY